MGYRAPSAEEVYRYALRLDSKNRSLTDRFGLSIVFVNDTSAVCREFIQKYCVDLCFRTADRIRFIFFSNIPEPQFHRIVNSVYQYTYQSDRHLRKTILGSVLERIGWDRYFHTPRLDYEYEPWRTLRPESLRPLHSIEDIQRQLDWEFDRYTAMPGAGIAMQFAQRLGIGRFVPCMLIFTDIGELHVSIMPVRSMHPDEIYTHVRNWVDGFYEVNQRKIERWRMVEDQIENLCSQARQSLSQVREWRTEMKEKWQNLLTIPDTIRSIEESEDHNDWARISMTNTEDYSLPYKIRNLFQEFLGELEQLEERNLIASQLRQAEEYLLPARTCEEIIGVLRKIDQGVFATLKLSLQPDIDQLAERLRLLRRPREELRLCWERYATGRIRFKRFKGHRDKWIHVVGEAGRDVKDEYKTVLAAIRQLPLSIDPERGATIILDALADHYSVDANSEQWQKATALYRGYIRNCLGYFFSYPAPEWLRAKFPEMTFQDILPSQGDLNPISLEEFLSDGTKLKLALKEAEASHSARLIEIHKENDDIGQQLQERVLAELHALIEQYTIAEDEWASTREHILAQLRQWRYKLEVQVYDASRTVRQRYDPRTPPNQRMMEQLAKALDEYDQVVETIQYPHLNDPLVQEVRLSMSVVDATGIKQRYPQEGGTQKLREDILKATENEEESLQSWTQVLNEAVDWTPGAKLFQTLTQVLGKERLGKVLSSYHGDSVWQKVENVISSHRVFEFLESLEREELAALARVLTSDDSRVPDNSVKSRHEIINIILSEIGIYKGGHLTSGFSLRSDTAKTLQEKIRKDEFDVFMAHNSKDKAAVLDISSSLRENGLYPWIDVEQIPPGRWFQEIIQSTIPKIKAAAIFIGRHGIGRWQELELRAFIGQCVERNIPVIPVLLPGVSEIPQELIFLRELNCVQFCESTDESEAMDRLIWGITGSKVA